MKTKRPVRLNEKREIHTRPTIGAYIGNIMEIYPSPSKSEMDGMEAPSPQLHKTPKEKKLVGTKNTKVFKYFSSSTGSKASDLLKILGSFPKKGNEPTIPNNTQPSQFKVGDLV